MVPLLLGFQCISTSDPYLMNLLQQINEVFFSHDVSDKRTGSLKDNPLIPSFIKVGEKLHAK
jgi:hypothetical protein